jgi:RNA polymerase sigma factor (sigma-70 family)
MKAVIRHLRRAALLDRGGGLTDGQLLESFLTRREEAAFEALLRRHGPMVLGVCRRVLGNPHDAEDAFQATFLVLIRKAASLRSRELVGNWLYGVAYRTAMKARAMSAKRRTKEKQAREAVRSEPAAGEVSEELLARLDAELNRLPEKYRVPVVLCDLEGKSRAEAARQLQIPEGTLSSRLAQARKLLAKKLSRHGAVLPVAAVAAVLGPNAGSACVPHPLLTSTTRAGMLAALGQGGLTAGGVPARVVALTEGVMKAMLLTKLKVAAWVALLAVCAGGGAAYQATATEPKQTADRPQVARPVENELEALRLEIEALRKGLQATRERVMALETEVKALRPKGGALPIINSNPNWINPNWNFNPTDWEMGGWSGNLPGQPSQKARPKEVADPVAEAEAALKKLRQDPSDKQATESLERALQRLKERAKPKPKVPGQEAK